MNLSPRRAERLALLAFFVQLLFFVLTLWIAASARSAAIWVEAWLFLGGVGIWLVLLLQFRQRRLAQEERFDVEQYQRLRREGKDTSVFEATAVEGSLHLAQRRLDWMEKYLLAVVALLVALGPLGCRLLAISRNRSGQRCHSGCPRNPSCCRCLPIRHSANQLSSVPICRGMSQQAVWRPLRAGGNYLFSNALACLALVVTILLADAGYPAAHAVCAYVLVGLLFAIGAEILLNLLLDLYRPRIQGRYRRAAYESRLLGLFGEPGGLLRTAAHAIDYQFGFKVSETWFYKLLERTVVPLLILQILVLYFMTSLAVVPPGQVGVLERWGVPLGVTDRDYTPYSSGLHLKYPWPMDTLRLFPVAQLQTIEVGFQSSDPGTPAVALKPILWTAQHWKAEFPFLVATSLSTAQTQPEKLPGPSLVESEDQADKRVDFNMLVVALSVHYMIDDVVKFGYSSSDHCYREPRQLLESICNRQAVHFTASSDLESLLGPGRHVTTETLHAAIQEQADDHELGVRIVFVGLQAVHPPVDVAEAFEGVVAALQDKQAQVLAAQGAARAQLAQAAGRSDVRLAQANAYKYRRAMVAQADADRFGSQLQAFKEGREVYLWRELLSVLDEYLPTMRKYVVAAAGVDSWVYEFDMKEKLQPDLFEGLGIEQNVQQEK